MTYTFNQTVILEKFDDLSNKTGLLSGYSKNAGLG